MEKHDSGLLATLFLIEFICFMSSRTHSWKRFHLATGTSQNLFLKLETSQYVPSFCRMLHSALLNFIKSLPASLSLIPSEYVIALHPVLQPAMKTLYNISLNISSWKLLRSIHFFPTWMLPYPTYGIMTYCGCAASSRWKLRQRLFYKKSLNTCRGVINLVSSLSLLWQIHIFSVLFNILPPIRNRNQFFNHLFQEFDASLLHIPFIDKVQGP